MKNEKSLLIFAHKAEAKSFLDERVWKPLSTQYSYQNKDTGNYLLICGEGTFNALEVTTSFLSIYGEEVSTIYNYGISGALDKELILEKLYPISHCYLEQLDEAQFHSYPTANQEIDTLSIISSSKRVLDSKYSNYLSAFAKIADRESWAIARAAKKFKKDLFCYKLISDFSGLKNDETNICDIAKENAHIYSEKFLNHFNKQSILSSPKKDSVLIGDNEFYFTATQERIFNNLKSKLNLKQFDWSSFFESEDFQDLRESPITAKKKTEQLLQLLSNVARPIQKKINERIDQVMLPLKKAGCQLSIDPALESSNFTIKKHIHNLEDIENLKVALTNLNYDDFLKVFEGKI